MAQCLLKRADTLADTHAFLKGLELVLGYALALAESTAARGEALSRAVGASNYPSVRSAPLWHDTPAEGERGAGKSRHSLTDTPPWTQQLSRIRMK